VIARGGGDLDQSAVYTLYAEQNPPA
jgi:hypothetical protein